MAVSLAICGLILIVIGVFLASMGFFALNYYDTYPGELTSEESLYYLLWWAYTGLMSISGTLWFLYGIKVCRYKETNRLPSKQEIDEPLTKYPKALFFKNVKQYPKYPERVLEDTSKEQETKEPNEHRR